MAHESPDRHLQRLRQWRNRPQRDLSMSYLTKQFKKEVERPYKQLHAIAQLWEQMVPEKLAVHARLESLSRGVLKVSVDSSAVRFELDRLLREGLERDLIKAHRGPAFRKVRLQVVDWSADETSSNG